MSRENTINKYLTNGRYDAYKSEQIRTAYKQIASPKTGVTVNPLKTLINSKRLITKIFLT